MNPKALIPLLIGLGVAGLAAKLGLDVLRKAQGKPSQTVQLWTPIEVVQRGIAVDKSMLRPLPFPADLVPRGALVDLEKIVGRIPHSNIPAGAPLLDSMLLPPGTLPGIQVPPGLRAVAVKIDESSGVDYHLEPGCHVDVVGLFTIRRNNRQETIARTILENVEVAAVGERLAPEVGSEEDKNTKSRRSRPARAVTLLVKPEQVPTLHLAEQRGKIKLSMRGALDSDQAGQTAQVTEAALLGEQEDEPATAQPAWAERFGGFLRSLLKSEQQEVPPAPAPPPTPPQPQLAWVMSVWNGDECRLLGWTGMNAVRPVELSAEGPNIFQDDPRQSGRGLLPPLPPGLGGAGLPGAGGWLPNGQQPPALPVAPQPQTDSRATTETEPEELFE